MGCDAVIVNLTERYLSINFVKISYIYIILETVSLEWSSSDSKFYHCFVNSTIQILTGLDYEPKYTLCARYYLRYDFCWPQIFTDSFYAPSLSLGTAVQTGNSRGTCSTKFWGSSCFSYLCDNFFRWRIYTVKSRLKWEQFTGGGTMITRGGQIAFIFSTMSTI